MAGRAPLPRAEVLRVSGLPLPRGATSEMRGDRQPVAACRLRAMIRPPAAPVQGPKGRANWPTAPRPFAGALLRWRRLPHYARVDAAAVAMVVGVALLASAAQS